MRVATFQGSSLENDGQTPPQPSLKGRENAVKEFLCVRGNFSTSQT